MIYKVFWAYNFNELKYELVGTVEVEIDINGFSIRAVNGEKILSEMLIPLFQFIHKVLNNNLLHLKEEEKEAVYQWIKELGSILSKFPQDCSKFDFLLFD